MIKLPPTVRIYDSTGNLLLKFAGALATAKLKNKFSNFDQMFTKVGQAWTNVLSWTEAEFCLSCPVFCKCIVIRDIKIFSFKYNGITS